MQSYNYRVSKYIYIYIHRDTWYVVCVVVMYASRNLYSSNTPVVTWAPLDPLDPLDPLAHAACQWADHQAVLMPGIHHFWQLLHLG